MQLSFYVYILCVVRFAVCSSLLIKTDEALTLRTLVLHNGLLDDHSKYSLLLSDLEKQFANVEVQNIKDVTGKIELVADLDSSRNLYKNLVIFLTGTKGVGKKLSADELLKFSKNEDGNVLVVSDESGAVEQVRVFLNQLGIYPSPKGYKVHDNFNLGEVLEIAEVLEDTVIAPTLKQDKLIYEGASALLSNNELLVPIVRGSRTSYNYNPTHLGKKQSEDDGKYLNEDNYWALGEQNYLIVGLQTLENSRVSWIGSTKFLTDDSYKASNYKNEKIFNDLLRWTSQEKNKLRIDYVEFYKTSDNSFNPKLARDTFKVRDEVVYNLAVSEYKDGQWVPYTGEDVQLEFTMLDPYYRLTLGKVSSTSPELSAYNPELKGADSNTTFFKSQETLPENTQFYSTKFRLPDQHGMFKFKINYRKPGYSFLSTENIITLRNLASDEFEKSWQIVNSWVYLTAIITLIAGWFVFLTLFLYGSDVKRVTTTKKTI